ncbi:MAG: DUF2917 domain-containing protein [Piscinibacter sp.]|nr:DUF2917 domain-containing protein [Piscinibacter sp.]
MSTTAFHEPLALLPHDVLRLGDAHGLSLSSAGGTLWITVDGEDRDIVLRPGESIRIDSHADTLVSPLRGPARLAFGH